MYESVEEAKAATAAAIAHVDAVDAAVAVSFALGPHHKPFESPRTARGLRARNRVGALHALWRAERHGAREKGCNQDRRTIRDWHHQRVQSRQRWLEWIRVLRNVSRTARDGTCPEGIEHCRERFGVAP